MVDTHIPQGKPGVAGFETESFGGPAEPRFGDGGAPTTSISFSCVAATALPLYAVIGFDGTNLIHHVHGTGKPYGILAAPIDVAAAGSEKVDIYRGGHWDMDVLDFDASYDTDEKKRTAFEGSSSPSILISKKHHNADAINV